MGWTLFLRHDLLCTCSQVSGLTKIFLRLCLNQTLGIVCPFECLKCFFFVLFFFIISNNTVHTKKQVRTLPVQKHYYCCTALSVMLHLGLVLCNRCKRQVYHVRVFCYSSTTCSGISSGKPSRSVSCQWSACVKCVFTLLPFVCHTVNDLFCIILHSESGVSIALKLHSLY